MKFTPLRLPRSTGSLTRRMIGVAGLWIVVLLGVGGFALDRSLKQATVRNFDEQLEYVLNAMILAADIDDRGDVRFTRGLADQRFLETYSGLYFQITGLGKDPFPSRSLWDRRLRTGGAHRDDDVHRYDSDEFADEPLRVVERDVLLPGSSVRWRFQIAEARAESDAQIAADRETLIKLFGLLGVGLLAMAALQAVYGLWPLRQVRRTLAAIRSGEKARIDERYPSEIEPMTEELNALLDHNERQAEEARRHAGNLAHALKTPLTVITNAAGTNDSDLAETVAREAQTMRRQVDHHLARARAIGRRASAQARVEVWPSLEATARAVDRLYEGVTVDIAGERDAVVRLERQDLDELLGNLLENAAKYGGGRVFVTVCPPDSRAGAEAFVDILVEDDGSGIPEIERATIFERGARLDLDKPGTGLGLAIVRDVAEIYGGTILLEESEDLGGLLARLRLPSAEG